jgi:hypothetical protein
LTPDVSQVLPAVPDPVVTDLICKGEKLSMVEQKPDRQGAILDRCKYLILLAEERF